MFTDKKEILEFIKENNPKNKFNEKTPFIELFNEYNRIISSKGAGGIKASPTDKQKNVSINKETIKNNGIFKAELNQRAGKLERISISNLNPNMGNIPADQITVINKYGTWKSVFPTNTSSYHMPHACALALMDGHFKFTQLRKIRESEKSLSEHQVGDFTVTHVREDRNSYNVVILPSLTKDELKDIQTKINSNK